MMSAEVYSNCSSQKSKEKNYSAGLSDYCCIPEFQSAFYNKRDGKRVKTGISLFRFPKGNTEKNDREILFQFIGEKEQKSNPKSTLFLNITSKQTRYVLA